MANWDDIKSEWETTKITLAALAEKHDIKRGTLKSRKSQGDGMPIIVTGTSYTFIPLL
ncbi:hypothetical protein RRU94_15630 [Domibacillus sp. DTU_2020_1001157_1_SI_ALB_TIR_016]|uniref:hypothetical protein n=1 Tax=Domibacillus sp. DTU_2020_1001157_1_SI_ALB_TIR_016 TaxID=3077789 RepID=UPI0028F10B31|nr:hypothetical protein [Domibacillus sp. DTU_2020_1001157_1_SI_ALB_TIR_016]WNS82484.1 hypothetical protein RRU94_15630 [Domibacillus sp. DTU_2020_1001157_1_SI_ALB_TIR_016]